MEKAQIDIGPANPEDMPDFLRLVRGAHMRTRGLDDCRWRIKATLDGTIVGVAAMEVLGPYAFMRSVAVDKKYRHRKIGLALWQNLLDRGREAGLRELYIVTSFYNVPRFLELGLELRKRRELPPEIKSHWQVSAIGFRLLAPMIRFMYLKLE